SSSRGSSSAGSRSGTSPRGTATPGRPGRERSKSSGGTASRSGKGGLSLVGMLVGLPLAGPGEAAAGHSVFEFESEFGIQPNSLVQRAWRSQRIALNSKFTFEFKF